jgi:diguanylate cyclase (GGDEF)-like protein/PAS domain S-box-containing protein
MLTLGMLLALLALAISWGAYLRADDLVADAIDVKLAIAQARVAVDEDKPDRAKELFAKLHDLTGDNPRQQARADDAAAEADVAAVRIKLDVMRSEEDAAFVVLQADAHGKRNLARGLLLVVMCFSLAFATASFAITRRGRREMIQQTALLGSVLDSIGDSVVAVDRDGNCVIVNAAFRRMFGVGFNQGQVGVDEAIRSVLRRVDGSALDFADGPFGRALRGEAIDNFDVALHVKSGERVFLNATARPVKNERREIQGAVVVFHDVTRERGDLELLALQAAELQMQSLSDELTGLYNRRGFTILSNQHARTALRYKRPFAVLFCDLNGLKTINDAHGHEAGDDAIKRMAAVLKVTFRESDIVARLGGDEYVALVDGADEASIETVLQRLKEELDLDAKNHDTPYRIHTSTGVAFQPAGGTSSIDELLTLADERMYSEKKNSKESRDARSREAEQREAEARASVAREQKLKDAHARLAQAQALNKTGPNSRAPAPPSSVPRLVPRPTPRASSEKT